MARQALDRIGNIIAPWPNWTSPVIESFEYLTTIITSRDGTEQRSAGRYYPRVSVSFQADETDDLRKRIETDLKSWPDDGLFVLPVRWRRVAFSADFASGSASITIVGSAPFWLQAGATVVAESATGQEVLTVESVSGSAVTFEDVTALDHLAGDRLMLGYQVRYDSTVSLKMLIARHMGGSVNLDVDPASFGAWDVPGLSSDWEFQGYPIFPYKPNWRDGLDIKIEDFREIADFGRGVIDVDRYRNNLMRTQTMTFSALNQERVDEILSFFMDQRGMRGHFFMPSWTFDMEPAADMVLEADVMQVKGREIYDNYLNDEIGTALCVVYPDGCMQFNRIIGTALVSGNTVFTFADNWVRAVPTGTQIYWGNLVRFGTDRLEVRWLTSDVAEMSIPVVVLPSDWIPYTLNDTTKVVGRVPGGSIDQPWENAPYTEHGMVESQVPPTVLAGEFLDVTINFYGEFNGNGTTSVVISLRVWFFDENDDELESPDGLTAQYDDILHSWPSETNVNYTETLGPIVVPPGTVYLRTRWKVTRGIDYSDVTAVLTSRWWSLNYEESNLKCP